MSEGRPDLAGQRCSLWMAGPKPIPGEVDADVVQRRCAAELRAHPLGGGH
jgi:hypothetical protein